MTPEERKEYNRKYREANKDKIKNYYEANKDKIKNYYEANKDKFKEYYKTNKEIIKKNYEVNKQIRIEYQKQYNKNNKEKRNNWRKQYEKNKRLTDPLFKLKHNIRKNISKSLKNNGYKKTSKTFLILGCSFEEFKQHLENQFEPWMTWDNYGLYNGTANYGWDVDHNIPSSSAITEEEVIKLNHYTNLKPLCSYTNRDIKKNKLS